VTRFVPHGTAKLRWLAGAASREPARAGDEDSGPSPPPMPPGDSDDFEPGYLGWEIARSATALAPGEQRALAALAAACVLSIRSGSTRLPLEGDAFVTALGAVGGLEERATAERLLARARTRAPEDAVATVMGRPGERKPLIVDGPWLYAERMHALEERFCARIRERIARSARGADNRSVTRAAAAVGSGPPPLTDEQKRAVREALAAPLTLITGGPGTGKTKTAVALLRAMGWLGLPMGELAIAAPTGKAAQRLADAISLGLAESRDLADAGLRAMAPLPQTLHRLLGWSPSRGRFARHENDPLPYRVVIVDEASMIDLSMMDRLVRALRDGTRLVLLGDADQLPSVEAGAVFRDLCVGLGAVRLTTNLRVAGDPSGRRIVAASAAVNAGATDARFTEAVARRGSVDEVQFEGVEHLALRWSDAGEALLAQWWSARIASDDGFTQRAKRAYRWNHDASAFDANDGAELRSLFEHYARSRLLCATRIRGLATSAEAINDRLLTRLRGGSARSRPWGRAQALCAGALVSVQRNDYERGLYNGDQGIVIRVASETAEETELMAVFQRGAMFEVFPLDVLRDLTPAFAMTVHKAQGSEFDHVAVILPDIDLPLLTRELLYTAMTRARRSVLLVGEEGLLARAVSRTVDRYSGVAARLKSP
jgi:exodeoxyribonuclease V alpha subunit